MSVIRRWLVVGLALAVATPAWAKGEKKDKKAAKAKADKADKADKDDTDADADADASDSSDDADTDDKATKKKPKAKAKATDKDKDKDKDKDDEGGGGGGGDDEGGGGEAGGEGDKAEKPAKSEEEPVKQDLNGHDLGTKKKSNEFERDRFFVDKVDTEKTENKTLVQGSLTSSSFFYGEKGGNYATPAAAGASAGDNSAPSRYFTDLRLQTDFRHVGGGRWDARVDGRIRFVNTPTAPTETITGAPNGHFQSGLTGQSEYELRELWLIRNGERTDVTLGRQFIADLAAVKIDGLRIDYASSSKLTYLGFAGLYPLRGSRSITTDYIDLKNPADPNQSAGKYVTAGGFGAAYRTQSAYGSVGLVALVPTKVESPRIFATSNGYYRVNPKLDFYHFALLDLVSGYGAQVTNLSAGLNVKPSQRLRLTASFNRTDTDSLNIQAAAFFDNPRTNQVVQNEIALQRLSTTVARGSVSAGLGNLQRIELTVAMAYRYRPAFSLYTYVDPATMIAPTKYDLDTATSVDVYGSIIDRHSFADARIGVDAIQTYGVGAVAYQRSEVFALRGFVGRELATGHGEWEAEVSYASTKDKGLNMACGAVPSCFGQSDGSVLSAGGTLYYRINRDWLLITQAYLSRTNIQTMGQAADPTITGLTGYLRLAYRF